ncbi:hypothetical protein BKA70DRAFT_1252635 [Coprinopsis sp. MPI-PUGE-AT-0042]|nr:hypothetical protein BKA70DRAFT_1252635 [Coprinopsis sp. MPI-PUGE-AT-0042]
MDQLPSDLFEMMFVRDDEFTIKHNPTAWTTVTPVCRHWREIALGYSVLWSNITIGYRFRPWIPVILERAENAALM